MGMSVSLKRFCQSVYPIGPIFKLEPSIWALHMLVASTARAFNLAAPTIAPARCNAAIRPESGLNRKCLVHARNDANDPNGHWGGAALRIFLSIGVQT